MKLGLSNTIKQGRSATWTPNNINSLLHWYRYDTGITTFFVAGAGNHVVTEWQDQKGSNHLVDTATPANTSAYNIAHPKQDQSTKEIIFDHGGDKLDLTSHTALGTFAVYVRLQFDDTGFGDFFMEGGSDNFLKIQDATNLRVKISGNRHDFVLAEELQGDTPYVIGYEREDTAATTNDRISVFVNGDALTQSGTGDGTQSIIDTLDLEQLGNPANTIRVKEIVICDNSLSSSDRTNLTNYLTAL